MNRIAAIFISQLILWFLVTGLNHELSRWQLQLSVLGMFLAYPTLRMGRIEGLFCALLAGLLLDAAAPIPFGSTALLLGVAHLLLLRLRPRIPFGEPLMQGMVAALAGLILYTARAGLACHVIPGVSVLWIRTFWELAASTVFAALAAPWFFALQERLVLMLRLPRERRLAGMDDED